MDRTSLDPTEPLPLAGEKWTAARTWLAEAQPKDYATFLDSTIG
jgi:hypothetical protein